MKLTYFDIKNVIYIFFGQIGNFIREYEDGFKHNNKKMFNEVAKKLKKICKCKYY